MTATLRVNPNVAAVGNESAVQTGGSFPVAASVQVGRGQFPTAAPATGYASLNDGTVPNQIGIGVGDPSFYSDIATVAGQQTVRVWQGETHGMVASTETNDSLTAADIGTPFFIANENTPGKLSNLSGSNRSLGGLVLGMFAGFPIIWAGVVAWLVARATLITNGFAHAWFAIADAAASDTIAERAIPRSRVHGLITAIQFTGAAVTGDNTDYAVITISKRDGAGGGAVSLGVYDTRITGNSTITAFTPASFTLSVVAGALSLLETDIVTITVTKGNAGKVLTGSILVNGKAI